ncbi:hypothetical protein P0082_12365 [Candidatus Haliotispira prima]|uniref:Lipoprotein n=1 Tax=Candidatus Haliotispira prima TaxID=3034016 RepID=A0ABY8MI62_9SPIO|nr:hypothetical protein P0082_12365 [Candidatus Haliotispira prima]
MSKPIDRRLGRPPINRLLRRLLCGILISAALSSCSSYYADDTYAEELADAGFPEQNGINYYGSTFSEYRFQNSRVPDKAVRRRLQLTEDQNIRHVLFDQYNRDFLADSPGKERLYIVGERQVVTEPKFQTQEEFHNLLLFIQADKGLGSPDQLGNREQSTEQNLGLRFPLLKSFRGNSRHTVKDFFLAVRDFSGDGQEDLLFGFRQIGRGTRLHYYLYSFADGRLKTIIQPWSNFSDEEHQNGTDKHYSPFMRELSANIYPAFVAEIELDLNYKINIDLSPLADSLIRDKVYDKRGLVLQKRGIPHLDFNPILFPLRHKSSGQYMIRSVQQVRSRYGQIGILVCNWIFRKTRWFPDESSLEFIAKPRI